MPQARVCVVDPIVAQVPMRRAEYPEVAKERYERAELRAPLLQRVCLAAADGTYDETILLCTK